MKKILLAVLAIIMAGCGGKNEENVITIGAVMTQSGGVAYWSNEMQKGMDMAYEELSLTDKERIKLKYEDNMFKQSLAISGFNKLVSIDKIDVAVTCFTPIAEALIPLAEKNKIPLVASVTSSTDIVKGCDWSFRDYITQQQQCPLLAQYMYDTLKMKKCVYIVINDDYGMDGLKQFEQKFEKLGGVVLGGEVVSQSVDFSKRNEIAKLFMTKPDFIFLIARDQLLINLCNQIRELDKDIQIVGVNIFDTDVVWNALQQNGEGIIFTSGYFDPMYNDQCSNFNKKYIEKYESSPNYTSVYGYSIMSYLLEICKQSNNSEEIKNNLKDLNVSTIRGNVYVLDNNDVYGRVGLYKREGNNTVLLMN